jgi:hypothetical protein
MTLTIILFLMAAAVLMLITIPFVMLMAEVEGLWENIKFWTIVAAIWAGVWFAVSWGN